MDAAWRIEMLGGVRAVCGDHVVQRFRSQRFAVLLAYLAFYPHRVHPRSELIELLWPELDPDVGRTNLRQALASLRRQLEPPGIPAGPVLLINRATVQLNLAAATSDVAEFEAALRAGLRRADTGDPDPELLRSAISLYRGELLPGCFDAWILPERQRLAEAFLQALQQLARCHEQAGDLQQAVAYLRRAIHAEPLCEEAHHDLIRVLAATGQASAALRQYRQMERLLAQETAGATAADIRALKGHIQRRVQSAAERDLSLSREQPPGLAARHRRGAITIHVRSHPRAVSTATPPAPPGLEGASAAAPVSRGYLPRPLSRFFGREIEIAHLTELLGSLAATPSPAPCGITAPR